MRQNSHPRSRRSVAARLPLAEVLESRLLMSTNAWKAAVSGDWTDATKWSLGHVPTATEDVAITVAGNYTVTAPAPAGTVLFANSLKVGGSTGTQVLDIGATLKVAGAFGVGAGDSINLNGGRLLSFAVPGTNDQIDGTLTLNGTATAQAILNVGSANLVGAGSIFLATGGVNSTSENAIEGATYSLGSSLTLHGLGGAITGTFTNKGTIHVEGGATDLWYLNTFTNQGTFTSTSGAALQIYGLTNAAGHTMTITGGSALFRGNTFTNAGVITATNAKLTYGMTFTSAGTVNRTSSPVLFAGILNGQNKPFVTSDAAGAWTWDGGTLQTGSYDPTAPGALKVDLTAPQGTFGSMQQVTLTGDLSIPAGFTISCSSGTMTLASGKRVLLNGTATMRSQFTLFGATLAGTGEIVFNTPGNVTANVVGGNTYTLGSGILVHGQSGFVTGGATNNGIILADTAGQTIQLQSVTNNGEIIAAPGAVTVVGTFAQNAAGAMTVGIGGTSPGSTQGVFHFNDAINAAALGGTFNAVLLNGYLPAAATAFNVAGFTKPPTGAFVTKNLDAGNGKAFDLTQTTAAISLKSKAVAGAFAARTAAGALTITGTAGADVISSRQALGVLYATTGATTSVFFDRQVVSETVNALAGNDAVTVTGPRGVLLNGGDGNDSLTGGGGNDSLNGGEGSDLLAGGGGNDTYFFSPALTPQTDTIAESANAGIDTLDFSALTTAVTVNLTSDAALATMANRTVKTAAAGEAANLGNVVGGSGNDTITGNAADNSLTGGAGNDVIDGGAGNDVLHGGLGNDKLTGGAGADSLYGEDGNDTLFGADGGTKDLLDGGPGTDSLGSADAVDTVVSVP